MVESAKIEKFKWDILGNFETMCGWLGRYNTPFILMRHLR